MGCYVLGVQHTCTACQAPSRGPDVVEFSPLLPGHPAPSQSPSHPGRTTARPRPLVAALRHHHWRVWGLTVVGLSVGEESLGGHPSGPDLESSLPGDPPQPSQPG